MQNEMSTLKQINKTLFFRWLDLYCNSDFRFKIPDSTPHKKKPLMGLFLYKFRLSDQMHQRYQYLFVSVRTVHRMLYVQLVLAQSCQ